VAQTRRTAAEATLREIEVKRKLGQLVAADGVRQVATECGHAVLHRFDQLLYCADDLCAAAVNGGPAAVRATLRAAIRELRVVIAVEFRRLAAGGGPGSA
jgi:hypothetical protein